MKKIYIAVGVAGVLVLGGGIYYAMSGSSSALSGLGKTASPRGDEEFISVQIQNENGTFSNPQKCSYEINSAGISFEVKEGEGENATPTGLTTKEVSGISIVQYQDGTDHKSLRFRFSKEGSDMFAKITEDTAKRGGTISFHVNNKVVSSPRVMSEVTSDVFDIDLNDSGITKAENILGKDNIKLTCFAS